MHRGLERHIRPEASAVGAAVHEHVVVEHAVEAQVPEAEAVDRLAELLLPVGAKRLIGPARARTEAPDVRENGRFGDAVVDGDDGERGGCHGDDLQGWWCGVVNAKTVGMRRT